MAKTWSYNLNESRFRGRGRGLLSLLDWGSSLPFRPRRQYPGREGFRSRVPLYQSEGFGPSRVSEQIWTGFSSKSGQLPSSFTSHECPVDVRHHVVSLVRPHPEAHEVEEHLVEFVDPSWEPQLHLDPLFSRVTSHPSVVSFSRPLSSGTKVGDTGQSILSKRRGRRPGPNFSLSVFLVPLSVKIFDLKESESW